VITLKEQVARIKRGDKVTARFRTDLGDEFVITGCVGPYMSVGGWQLSGDNLVAIESHEPAKPSVPPEPKGDVLVVDTAFGRTWERGVIDNNWRPADGGILGDGEDWSSLFNAFGPLKAYRPEPSPERVEELVQQYEPRVSGFGITSAATKDALREFARELSGSDE
jgi:hypothetical protein